MGDGEDEMEKGWECRLEVFVDVDEHFGVGVSWFREDVVETGRGFEDKECVDPGRYKVEKRQSRLKTSDNGWVRSLWCSHSVRSVALR